MRRLRALVLLTLVTAAEARADGIYQPVVTCKAAAGRTFTVAWNTEAHELVYNTGRPLLSCTAPANGGSDVCLPVTDEARPIDDNGSGGSTLSAADVAESLRSPVRFANTAPNQFNWSIDADLPHHRLSAATNAVKGQSPERLLRFDLDGATGRVEARSDEDFYATADATFADQLTGCQWGTDRYAGFSFKRVHLGLDATTVPGQTTDVVFTVGPELAGATTEGALSLWFPGDEFSSLRVRVVRPDGQVIKVREGDVSEDALGESPFVVDLASELGGASPDGTWRISISDTWTNRPNDHRYRLDRVEASLIVDKRERPR